MYRIPILTLASLFILDPGTGIAQQTGMRITASGQGIEVHDGEQPVLFYQARAKSMEGQWSRAAYVHPLYDLDGQILTEDFPADHRHHRGVFWAWHQLFTRDLQLGDAWVCKDFVRDLQSQHSSVSSIGKKRVAVIDSISLWKSPLLKDLNEEMLPIVQERVLITVHERSEAWRCVDFDISLLAVLKNVRIGGSDDVKGYGGFSARIQLNPQQVFRFQSGEVEPAKKAVSGGPWVDISDDRRGLAIMVHPSNPMVGPAIPKDQDAEGTEIADGQEEQPAMDWILRRKRSMQNAVYPGRTPVSLSTKVPTRLRYRLVIHDGKQRGDSLQAIYEDYAAQDSEMPEKREFPEFDAQEE